MYQLEELTEYIKDKNVEAIKYLLENTSLKVVDGKFVMDKKEGKDQETFWNQRQQARKILLNSLNLGALRSNS